MASFDNHVVLRWLGRPMGDIPNVAINGFGRIGRLVTRCLVEMEAEVNLVAINDLADAEHLAHLFQFDSTHGRFPGHIEQVERDLVINGDRFRVIRETDPARLPWGELGVDYVIECSGHFRDRAALSSHLDAGAKRVVLSAPGQGLDVTLVRGVNDDAYDPDSHRLVSNASCTTNCLAPVIKVLDDAFGIEHGLMTTVHAYTNDQPLLDTHHKDLRRSRAAALSMVPTSTGAAQAIGDVLPHLAGRIDGLAIRVPTPNVSLVDLTARVRRDVSVDDVTSAFRTAATGPLNGILASESRPLVSVDFNHDPHSATVDEASLMVVDGSLVKVLAWYDNEWGYAMRTAELVHDLWAQEG